MKMSCRCGAVIVDQTDDLPQKAHVIPDQEWFATYDAIDNEVIAPLAAGRLGKEAADRLARRAIGRSARLMWPCRVCGRLYIHGCDGQLRCFVPEGEPADREIIRSRPSQAEPDAATDSGGMSRFWLSRLTRPPPQLRFVLRGLGREPEGPTARVLKLESFGGRPIAAAVRRVESSRLQRCRALQRDRRAVHRVGYVDKSHAGA